MGREQWSLRTLNTITVTLALGLIALAGWHAQNPAHFGLAEVARPPPDPVSLDAPAPPRAALPSVLCCLLHRKRQACHVRDAACQPGKCVVRLNRGRCVLWSCSQRRPVCSRQQSFRSFRPQVSACMSTLCVRQPYAYAVLLCAT